MSPAYVIITCGWEKSADPAPAGVFYRGEFHRNQASTARALRPRGGTIILSNVHGFMRPDHIIPGPYNSHWGYPDTMPDDRLLAMIDGLDLRHGDYVVNLGAGEYARQTRRLFPEFVRVIWPAKHLPRGWIGYQRTLHKQMRLLGAVPSRCMSECEFTFEDV